MTRKRLPPATHGPRVLHGLTLKDYTVGSWCPTPDGTGPPTAVGLTLRVELSGGTDMDLTMRLKTPEAVDGMIQSLLRHKRDVWPDSK